MNRITRRTAALAGIVLGPVWLGTVALLTWAEWDFLHSVGWTFTDSGDVGFPSVTARGPYGFVQVVNFALAGTLAAVFLVGFRREFHRRTAGRVATAALGLFALAGACNACLTDLPDEPVTWHGNVHMVGFFATVVGAHIGFAASGLALRGNPDWRRWRLLGWAPAVMLTIAFTGLGLPGDTSFYLFLVVLFGWFSVMGVRLLQLSSAESAPTSTGEGTGFEDSAHHRTGVPAQADASAPGLL